MIEVGWLKVVEQCHDLLEVQQVTKRTFREPAGIGLAGRWQLIGLK